MDNELDGMAALTQGVENQTFPHTIDAQIWAKEWMKTIKEHPSIPTDEGAMIGWFANAIMAGVDTSNFRYSKSNVILEAECKSLREVASWSQSVLTGLNIGDIQNESPLHKKLREVMIAHRERAEELGFGPR